MSAESPARTQMWMVEIVIEGFGPWHRLWTPFVDRLRLQHDPRVEWVFHDMETMHAGVEADSPEAAIRLAIAILTAAGRDVDPLDRVFWAGARGFASRA